MFCYYSYLVRHSEWTNKKLKVITLELIKTNITIRKLMYPEIIRLLNLLPYKSLDRQPTLHRQPRP